MMMSTKVSLVIGALVLGWVGTAQANDALVPDRVTVAILDSVAGSFSDLTTVLIELMDPAHSPDPCSTPTDRVRKRQLREIARAVRRLEERLQDVADWVVPPPDDGRSGDGADEVCTDPGNQAIFDSLRDIRTEATHLITQIDLLTLPSDTPPDSRRIGGHQGKIQHRDRYRHRHRNQAARDLG